MVVADASRPEERRRRPVDPGDDLEPAEELLPDRICALGDVEPGLVEDAAVVGQSRVCSTWAATIPKTRPAAVAK
jgi:hypothetical protein